MASIVHNPGRRDHLTGPSLRRHVADRDGAVIGDSAAQTIAAMWHSPVHPDSMLLSTTGMVTSNVCITDFALERSEWPNAYLESERIELDALERYILHYQEFPTTPTGVYPCDCMDCGEAQYGRKGDLCDSCEEAGCSGNWPDECQRDDAYGDTECAADYNDDDYGCMD